MRSFLEKLLQFEAQLWYHQVHFPGATMATSSDDSVHSCTEHPSSHRQDGARHREVMQQRAKFVEILVTIIEVDIAPSRLEGRQ